MTNTAPKYKKQLKLSGIFYKVEREQVWDDICFEDMTEVEQKKVLDVLPKSNVEILALKLANTLNKLGEDFEIKEPV